MYNFLTNLRLVSFLPKSDNWHFPRRQYKLLDEKKVRRRGLIIGAQFTLVAKYNSLQLADFNVGAETLYGIYLSLNEVSDIPANTVQG